MHSRGILIKALVDVIIPAYNAAQFISQTLQSLVTQSAFIHSVIVVNDGSTDLTAQIVRGFSAANPSLKVNLIEQTNQGLAAARNAGLRAASAPLIAFLDADDLWLSEKLQRQCALFESSADPKLAVVYCDYALIDAKGQELASSVGRIRPSLKGQVYSALLRGNFISGSGSSVLIKRSALEAVGPFDETLAACEDWEMWLRLAAQFHFDFVPEALVHIRVHEKNMQKDANRMLGAELLVLNKLILRQQANFFLLWKIRTILISQNKSANTIPTFAQCSTQLKAKLSGLPMLGARVLLFLPVKIAQGFLKHKNAR